MVHGLTRPFTLKSSSLPRFDVWPYLEQFSYDAAVALEEELGEKPDFIIGSPCHHRGMQHPHREAPSHQTGALGMLREPASCLQLLRARSQCLASIL